MNWKQASFRLPHTNMMYEIIVDLPLPWIKDFMYLKHRLLEMT